MHPNRKSSIDVGLAVLSKVMQPGQSLGTRDIADICGVSNSCIWQIEQRALRKIRKAIRKRYNLSYDELLTKGTSLFL